MQCLCATGAGDFSNIQHTPHLRIMLVPFAVQRTFARGFAQDFPQNPTTKIGARGLRSSLAHTNTHDSAAAVLLCFVRLRRRRWLGELTCAPCAPGWSAAPARNRTARECCLGGYCVLCFLYGVHETFTRIPSVSLCMCECSLDSHIWLGRAQPTACTLMAKTTICGSSGWSL